MPQGHQFYFIFFKGWGVLGNSGLLPLRLNDNESSQSFRGVVYVEELIQLFLPSQLVTA